MSHIDFDEHSNTIAATRHTARTLAHVQRAQMMLVVAGLAAFGIVAVAATMMMALF